MAWKRRGGRKVIIAPDGGDAWVPAKPRPEETVIRALARAHRWKRMLEQCRYRSAGELAEAEGVTRSFVNRLLRLTRARSERSCDALPQDRPRRASDRALVRRAVPRGPCRATARDRARPRCHRRSAARPSGRPVLPRLLRLLLLPAALRLLRPASARGQAPALEHRCLGRRVEEIERIVGQIRADVAAGADRAARRFRLRPRAADGVVRRQPRRLRLRPRPQRAAGKTHCAGPRRSPPGRARRPANRPGCSATFSGRPRTAGRDGAG